MNRKILIIVALGSLAIWLFFGVGKHDIWDAIRKNDVSYVQDYLDKGGNVNLTRAAPRFFADPLKGSSLLMEAVKHGNIEVATILINHKARINARDASNDTPLMYAAQNGNTALIQLLLDHHANINWDVSSRKTPDGARLSSSAGTPLAHAIFYGHIDAVRLLLDNGARITDQCISVATYFNRPDIIQLLLDYGAHITKKDVEFAEEINQKAIAELLKKQIK